METGDVFTIASGKGGVGKTTTSINLGATLAERNLDVILVEMDLAMANIADYLDLSSELEGSLTLHDVLSERRDVFDAVLETGAGFDLLPSGLTLEGFADVDVTRLQWVLQALKEEYDVVLLDTGAGLSEETVFPLKLADGVLLATSPRRAAVRDTKKTRQLADTAETDVIGVVFTKDSTEAAPPLSELANALGVDLLGHIPTDSVIPAAQDAGVSIIEYAPDSAVADEYREITRQFATRAIDKNLVELDLDSAARANGSGEDEAKAGAEDDDDGRSLTERAKRFVGLGS